MKPVCGCIVKSVAGHDGGSHYVVVGTGEGTVFIADGKSRKLENPKRKNVKHVRAANTVVDLGFYETDSSLRKLLAPLNAAAGRKFGQGPGKSESLKATGQNCNGKEGGN